MFEALAAKFSGKPRPGRLCPCGSRRALKDCHWKARRYSEHGICPCGAGKVHEKCCAKRQDMYWVEQWQPRDELLWRFAIIRISPDPKVQKTAEEQQVRAAYDPDSALVANLTYGRAVLKGLKERGKIDLAYAAAGLSVDISPV